MSVQPKCYAPIFFNSHFAKLLTNKKHTDGQTDRHKDRQTDGQTEKQQIMDIKKNENNEKKKEASSIRIEPQTLSPKSCEELC